MIDAKTNEEVIKAWRNYEPIWVIEMGGMGPNYEIAIQNLAFSILENWLENNIDKDDVDAMEFLSDPIIKELNETYGYSGAQVGAARNIAAVFYKNGYQEGLDMIEDKDRKVMYTNTLPRESEAA